MKWTVRKLSLVGFTCATIGILLPFVSWFSLSSQPIYIAGWIELAAYLGSAVCIALGFWDFGKRGWWVVLASAPLAFWPIVFAASILACSLSPDCYD
jgi:hypothetical protein